MSYKIINQMKRNLFKFAYEEFWVPVFGRILMNFAGWIEGKKPQETPTYDLRDKKKK